MSLMFWKDMPEAMIAVCMLDGFAIIFELARHAISKWSHSTSYLFLPPDFREKSYSMWQSKSKCQPSENGVQDLPRSTDQPIASA